MITSIEGLGSMPPEMSLLRLGFIGLGEKTEDDLPKKVDHFVLPGDLESRFGKECRQLPILLPFSEREKFCSQQWRREVKIPGGGRKAMCRGNGAGNGLQHVKVKDNDWAWQDIDCTGYDCSYAKDRYKSCKKTADFKFYVACNEMLSSGVYQITTHNSNSMRYINANVELFQKQFGRIDLLPLWLNIIPDDGRDGKGKKYKFYSLTLTLRMTEREAFLASRNIPLGSSIKTSDSEQRAATDDSSDVDHEEIYKQVCTFAERIKELDSDCGNSWLKALCWQFHVKDVKDITKGRDLEKLREDLIKKGKELSVSQK